ncbi:radical SAM family heme chaperone HemW [Salsipaludibacter albus]|uniref:radical SAM family heme chaperone HemW n=1 Tax=Salsipaludibacter albus TaxID=2849650 RepID=UPI001EE492E6|nr:radical SAM family heme chaperone HemW [Salsipaludibacter albus]MBY5162201.1 radical SAM family heme chaperone HemW [Salsipaludibacter albus]
MADDVRRWLDHPVESGTAAGFGLYLHVPFCSHRCGYCDFATHVADPADADAQMARYATALRRRLVRVLDGGRDGAGEHPWPTVTSVFVGGGTPTLLPPDELASILATVDDHADLADDVETTVEANPETVGPAMFTALVDAGATRVSMGAQSFAPHVLATLERGHTADRPVEAVAEARAAGIAQVSLDLIYGTPGETDDDFARSLEAALGAGVDHLSAYALSIHTNTPFGRRRARGELPDVDDDVAADRFDLARDRLAAADFEHYEVSNWARTPGTRSRHNVLYWRHGDYLAFGVGAHGHLDGRRWWNPRGVGTWLAAVEADEDPAAATEQLDLDERRLERLLLGLRLRDGLHPHDVPPLDPLALEDAMAHDLVETACGRVRATDRGWYLLDEAVRRLA